MVLVRQHGQCQPRPNQYQHTRQLFQQASRHCSPYSRAAGNRRTWWLSNRRSLPDQQRIQVLSAQLDQPLPVDESNRHRRARPTALTAYQHHNCKRMIRYLWPGCSSTRPAWRVVTLRLHTHKQVQDTTASHPPPTHLEAFLTHSESPSHVTVSRMLARRFHVLLARTRTNMPRLGQLPHS